MANYCILTFRTGYFLAAVALFATEVYIARCFHGGFVRLYFGDYLVVILLYCLVRAFVRVPVPGAACGVLVFSFAVEVSQYFHVLCLLGLESFPLARLVFGTAFEWGDLLAYTAGIATVLIVEKLRSVSGGIRG